MDHATRRTAAAWVALGAVSAAATALLWLAGAPTPALFGPLAAGLAWALLSPVRLELPTVGSRAGQAVLGAVVGAVVTAETLASLRDDLAPIALVTLATLLLGLAAGWLLARRRDVDLSTGVFAMIAGGAAGVVAVARELGADERVVAVVQYLRVLVVLLTMPVVAVLLYGGTAGGSSALLGGGSVAADVAFTAIAVLGGLGLARVVPVPAGGLLLPLGVASVLAATGVLGPVGVPVWLQWPAYALIGVQVGLRFTRSSLRAIASMLPAVVGLIVAMVVGCAAMGWGLTLATDVDPLTAYLATTPGGLFAVLATAVDSDADAAYVLALQVVRLLVMLVLTPFLARLLDRRRQP